jgi:hypothetical protein
MYRLRSSRCIRTARRPNRLTGSLPREIFLEVGLENSPLMANLMGFKLPAVDQSPRCPRGYVEAPREFLE